MSSAAPLGLHKDVRIRQDAFGFSGHCLGAGPNNYRGHRAARLEYGVEHVTQERATGNGV